MSTNYNIDIDLNEQCFVNSNDFFDIIGNIEERLKLIAFKFSIIRNERNNDSLYSDISVCFRDIANDLKEIKTSLKIKFL